ncbi:hypothetical protein HDU86_002366 [Geranomyces michiganensis]|nr:hypothetical protein HDU86_002366 [Geranomyces michiganensis]
MLLPRLSPATCPSLLRLACTAYALPPCSSRILATTPALNDLLQSHIQFTSTQTTGIHTSTPHRFNHHSTHILSSSSPTPRHKPPPAPSAADRHLNIGTATRILRDELPHFPTSGLLTDEIYADDVAFIEPHRSRLSVRGKRWYKLLAGTVHSGLVIAFSEAELNVVSVQQRGGVRGGNSGDTLGGDGISGGSGSAGDSGRNTDPDGDSSNVGGDDIQLVIRWIFEGTPRLHPGLVVPQDRLHHPVRSVYEGVFVYRFDAEGKVCEHRLEAIHPEPPFAVNWMAGAFGGATGSRAPVATSSQVGIHASRAK